MKNNTCMLHNFKMHLKMQYVFKYSRENLNKQPGKNTCF